MGSGGLATSTNAWRMRKRALAGNAGRFAYVEHTAESVSLVDGRVRSERPDVLDRDGWARANAAYGRRIEDEKLEDLYGELGADLFARECLCLWDAELSDAASVIDPVKWAALEDVGSKVKGRVAFAYDVSHDRSTSTVACCGRRSDGQLHVEIVERRPGTSWLMDRIPELRDRHSPVGIGVDPGGPSGAVIAGLADAGVELESYPTQRIAQACGGFLNDVTEVRLRHLGDPDLNKAVAVARPKVVGDAWRWERIDGADLSPLYAATIARHLFLSREDREFFGAWD
jgi:hypothetical protein